MLCVIALVTIGMPKVLPASDGFSSIIFLRHSSRSAWRPAGGA
jgi:hypothetical protein